MKKRKTTSLVIIAIIIVIVGIVVGNGFYQYNHNKDYYYQSNVKKIADVFKSKESIDMAISNFIVYDTASITKLFFADKSGHQTLLQRNGDVWMLNDLMANKDLVNQMLYTINRIHIKPVSIKKTDNIITQMASTNTKVEVYQTMPRINLFNKIKLFYHETLSKVFYVGGVTQDHRGTYVLQEGGNKVYIAYLPALNGSISSRFSAKPIDWRDHHIFMEPLDNIASVKLEINGDPHNSFIINEINRAQFTMNRLDGEPVDFSDNKVLTLMMEFKDVRFESFLDDVDPARRDSIINSPFQQRLTLTTKDGKSSSVTTFRLITNADVYEYSPEDIEQYEDMIKDPDHQYALLSEGNDFVLIQKFVFGKLLKPADYYSKDYKEDIQTIYYKELEMIESR